MWGAPSTRKTFSPRWSRVAGSGHRSGTERDGRLCGIMPSRGCAGPTIAASLRHRFGSAFRNFPLLSTFIAQADRELPPLSIWHFPPVLAPPAARGFFCYALIAIGLASRSHQKKPAVSGGLSNDFRHEAHGFGSRGYGLVFTVAVTACVRVVGSARRKCQFEKTPTTTARLTKNASQVGALLSRTGLG